MTHTVREIDWAAIIIRACKGTAAAARPHLDLVNAVAVVLPDVFEHFGITTTRRQAHFISQSIIECDYYKTLEEYASGDAYDQRTDMGFTPAKDGDGRLNKGFGIFQNTGPNNQRAALKALKALGFDVTQDVSKAKSVLTVPKYAAWAAGIWWNDNKMNPIADKDADGTLCSRQVNRGNYRSTKAANHEADRKRAFKATWAELQNPRLVAPIATAAASLVPPHAFGTTVAPPPVLTGEDIEFPEVAPEDQAAMNEAITRGMAPGMDPQEHQDQVAEGKQPDAAPPSPAIPLPAEPVAPGVPAGMLAATQQRLDSLGFHQVGLANGEAGHRTVGAIAAFQAVAGLPVTGQLDNATMVAVWSDDAPRAPVAPERALATASDLRPSSTIVDATAKASAATLWQAIIGGVVAVFTAIMSGFSDTMTSLKPLQAVFTDVPGVVWGMLGLAIVSAPSLYAYIQAKRAQRARVQDFNTGKTS